jgi:hypothetical protein
VTEAEARAALRASVGAGHVEPWIAQQAWEATPHGWTVPRPLDGWIFRVEPVAGGVRVTAFMDKGDPAAWVVPAARRAG